VRILLYRAQVEGELANLKPGIELANELIDWLLSEGYNLFALETLLLRAQLHTVAGDEQASAVDYLTALQMGEPEGIISIFVEEGPQVAANLERMLKDDQLGTVRSDYVKNILAAFASTRKTAEEPATLIPNAEAADQLIEPLTNRELDVLRLMAEGMKYEQIGEQLYISLNTVRYHVKSIYSKLNVNNRTKAIERANLLGVL
jgi:LuxR family maltose regulon positive regulatory protein